MYYADIKKVDVANGPGVRVSLFVSGCTHKCKGCFNEEAWDFKYGHEYTQKEEDKIIELLKPDYIEGITILGGEPFEYVNQKGILPLLRRIRKELPNKTIWLYTGFLWEEIKDIPEIADIDVICEGKFVKELLDNKKHWVGSTNQRVVDVKASLENNKVVLHE